MPAQGHRDLLSRRRTPMGRRGTTLLETILAVVIMAGVGLAVVAMLQKATIASLQARERMTCGRMAQSGMARLKNMDFFYLFAVDSSVPGWATPGLHASYPYTATLNGLKSTLAASKFDRFRVDVTFMRRDSTDARGTGNVSNLIAFKDDGAGRDAYDPSIRFFDQDGDGDYYETYSQSGKTVSEQPDTHIKMVTLSVYRRGRVACSATEMISLEQFTGQNKPNSEAVLYLEVSTPTNNSYAYQLTTPAQIAARSLAISASYPADVFQYRADAFSAMPMQGLTNPLSSVEFYAGASAVLASAGADATGGFASSPVAVTTALAEGQNTVRARATKSTYTSPWAERSVLLDVDPPVASGASPTGTVNTRQPFVSATLTDPVVNASASPSGICSSVIGMKVNGAAVGFSYAASSGTVVWIDTATQASPILADGTYTVSVEGGDFAGYKTSATWSFTVAVPATDNSAPSIANKTPIGAAASDLPLISVRVFDNQSGIDPASVVMTVDGAAVSASYDPGSGTVTYVPAAAFSPSTFHTATITANHWASDPPSKVTSADAWSFWVP